MTTQEERISRLEGAYEHLATKADVEEVKVMIADLRGDMANLRADMANQNAKLETDMADLRTKIADAKAEITWRVAGLQLAGLAAVAAIMGFLR